MIAPGKSFIACRALNFLVGGRTGCNWPVARYCAYSAPRHVTLHVANGKDVYPVKAVLSIPKPSHITTFFGLPTKRIMLAVLAAANSDISRATKYIRGVIGTK